MASRIIRKVNAEVDERLGTQSFLKDAFDHIFPDNWSFMLGELAMYCFIILVITGVYLAMFFDPSDTVVTYKGPYMPMHGVKMPVAYETMIQINLQVRGGILFRQMHHWAALLFLGAIIMHLARLFFTGAFRKPRDLNWTIGATLLLLSMLNGFTGYSLPDDLLSGLGLRIFYTILQSVPVAGNWLSYLVFGGQYPSDQITHRLYIVHVFVIPLLIAGLIGAHLAVIWRQKHTVFPGEGRSERKLVGSQMWPVYAFRSIALFFFTIGLIAILAGTTQINPVWLYGPYEPWSASSFAQPDSYVGWLIGALRLFPKWQLHLFGYTVADVFWPGFVFPMLAVGFLYAYPLIERLWTSDLLLHNVLDRPRDRPGRTGFGVAVIVFFGLLTLAGAEDVLAHFLQTSQTVVMLATRGACIVAPPVAGLFTWKMCKDLSTAPAQPSEPPEGPASSGTPPIERYLPERVRFETPVDGDGESLRPAPISQLQRRAAGELGDGELG